MPLSHMPAHGCEHLDDETVDRVRTIRSSRSFDPHFTQYRCLLCPTSGGFAVLNEHFTQSKHDFAINQKAIYCGKCRDLVYEPSSLRSPWKRKLKDLTEEQEAYLTANTMPKPCGREGVRGLYNLGETCYMNAVLQMMVHNSFLCQYFMGMGHPLHTCPISNLPDKKNDSDDDDDDDEEKDQKVCVACAFTELFSDANTVDAPLPTHAVNLLFASWKHIPDMSGKGQQDAQEWFTLIIEKLHDSAVNVTQSASFKASRQPCSCFFHKIFYGRFSSTVKCDVCHNPTVTESEFSSIDLDFQKQKKRKKKLMKEATTTTTAGGVKSEVNGTKKASSSVAATLPPGPTLTECLSSYTAPEPLSQESQQIDCRTCGRKTNAHKSLRLDKLPIILTMHVKRFGMKKPSGSAANGTNGTSSVLGVPEKYEGKLDFPLSIDMGPYTTEFAASKTTCADAFTGKASYVYDLDAVVVHQGEHAHTGHYFAFVRVAAGEGKEMRWFRFDDEIVTATTIEDVLRQEAYLLFYGARDVGKYSTRQRQFQSSNGTSG